MSQLAFDQLAGRVEQNGVPQARRNRQVLARSFARDHIERGPWIVWDASWKTISVAMSPVNVGSFAEIVECPRIRRPSVVYALFGTRLGRRVHQNRLVGPGRLVGSRDRGRQGASMRLHSGPDCRNPFQVAPALRGPDVRPVDRRGAARNAAAASSGTPRGASSSLRTLSALLIRTSPASGDGNSTLPDFCTRRAP